MNDVCLKSTTAAGLLLAAVLICATPASAQQTGQMACEPDAFRLCSQYIPDEKTTGDCLARNRSKLSPACRALFPSKATKKKKRRARRS